MELVKILMKIRGELPNKIKYPKDSEVTSTYIIQPPQTNTHGTAFGGQILAWMDETAAIAAQRHCHMPCVTASVDKVQFTKAIPAGHILIMKARVNFTGINGSWSKDMQ